MHLTYPGPSVDDVHEFCIRISLHNAIKQLLILDAACAETRQGLAAPAQGSLLQKKKKKKKKKITDQ